MQIQSTICIAGIGNTLRSDDGIGAYICRELEKDNIRNASFLFLHQLQTEMIEDFYQYDYVLFIDAAINKENKIDLNKINPGDYLAVSSSHVTGLGIIAGLMTNLMGTSPSIYLCAVPGHNFSFGETLSQEGKAYATEAIKKIKSWLYEHGFMNDPAYL